MGIITVLPKILADQIAAGEVVERPAAVVKELAENALDAGCRTMLITITDAGRREITVSDDGCGMSAEDVACACVRHATSKIKTVADLGRIQSLGFRGEALASIAAVSRFTMTSRMADAPLAHTVEIDGGRPQPLRQDSRAPGTTVSVRDLFFNVPARLKFMKTSATELAHSVRVVTELALAHPAVGITLRHNREELFSVTAGQTAAERIPLLVGADEFGRLAPLAVEVAPVAITGFVRMPPLLPQQRKMLYFFVNQRPIQDRLLTHAVLQAYEGAVPAGTMPAAVLFLSLAPELVDVNVHPTKREVRFRDPAVIHDVLKKAVRQVITRPAAALFSTAAPADNRAVAPGSDMPLPESERRFEYEAIAGTTRNSVAALQEHAAAQLFAESWQAGSIPNSCISIANRYVAMPTPEGLLIMDQHAAHERVMFEALMRQVRQRQVEQQRLLLPRPARLGPAARQLLTQHQTTLAQLGFEVESFGGDTVVVQAYPAVLGDVDAAAIVAGIIDASEELGDCGGARESMVEAIARRACQASVRSGKKMSASESAALLAQLRGTELAAVCPHGRPTMIVISTQELDKRFGRT